MPLRPEERRAKEQTDAIISALKDTTAAVDSLRSDLQDQRRAIDALTAETRAQGVQSASSQSKLLTVQWWLFGATAAAFLAAAIYAGISRYQLSQIQQQTTIAESQSRPWLKIVAVDLDPAIILDKKEPVISFVRLEGQAFSLANIRVEFTIENIGKGVAQNVYISPNLIFELWNDTNINKITKDQQFVCADAQKRDLGAPFTWSAVFPGEKRTFRVIIAGQYTEQLVSHIPKRSGSWLAGVVHGCVVYQRPLKYETAAVFHVMGEHDRFIEVGKQLDETQVHLLRDDHYEHAQ